MLYCKLYHGSLVLLDRLELHVLLWDELLHIPFSYSCETSYCNIFTKGLTVVKYILIVL